MYHVARADRYENVSFLSIVEDALESLPQVSEFLPFPLTLRLILPPPPRPAPPVTAPSSRLLDTPLSLCCGTLGAKPTCRRNLPDSGCSAKRGAGANKEGAKSRLLFFCSSGGGRRLETYFMYIREIEKVQYVATAVAGA